MSDFEELLAEYEAMWSAGTVLR